MSAIQQLLAAGGASGPNMSALFATTLYTGTGASQSIANGLDMSAGSMLWRKDTNGAALNHWVTATPLGASVAWQTNTTGAETTGFNSHFGFSSTGFTVDLNNSDRGNASGVNFAAWAFRRIAKFFDCGTYAGNSTAGRTISHALTQTPGMIFVRPMTLGGFPCVVWHRGLAAGEYLALTNTNPKATSSNIFGNGSTGVQPTSSVFTVGSNSQVNTTSETKYFWAAFGHDADTGILCPSFTTDGSGAATINHGWPNGVQFCMMKASNNSTNGDWQIMDTKRTPSWTGNESIIFANSTSTPTSSARLSGTGSTLTISGLNASEHYVALIIAA